MLGNDIKVMTEPNGKKPYDACVNYNYIGTPSLNYSERVGIWDGENYLIAEYFDYDTYGPDKPIVVTFGVRWVLSRDLYNALMRRYIARKEVEALEEEQQANFKPGDDETEFFKKMYEIIESANDPD